LSFKRDGRRMGKSS